MSTLIVVDGPNLHNRVGDYFWKQRPSEGDTASWDASQAVYIREWFDVDRLVNASIALESLEWAPGTLGTVIFHSTNPLGPEPGTCPTCGTKQNESAKPKPHRLNREESAKYWVRQAQNPHSSAMQVSIPGAPPGAEKGIDTSIVLYLFESIAKWEGAVIVSDDTDFVPLVWALRRQGKRVYSLSMGQQKDSPLAVASQHALPFHSGFLETDRALFEFLRVNGPLDAFAQNASVGPSLVHFNVQGHVFRIGGRQAVLQELLTPHDQKPLLQIRHSGEHRADLVTPHVPGAFAVEGILRHRRLFENTTWIKYLKA